MARKPRRTPLEIAIAKATEPKTRYEAKQRAAGLTRVAVWVPDTEEAREQVQELARRLRGET